jgi:hypothetical protein
MLHFEGKIVALRGKKNRPKLYEYKTYYMLDMIKHVFRQKKTVLDNIYI